MSATNIALCTTLVTQFRAALPPDATLTAADRKRLLRMRKGGGNIIPTVLSLAAEYGVQSTRTSSDMVQSQVDTAQGLASLASNLGLAAKALDDYIFALQSSAWGTTTSLYTFLRRLSKTDGALATGLAPVAQFFAARSAAVKADHPKTAKGKAALKAKKSATNPAVPGAVAQSSGSSSVNGNGAAATTHS